MLNFKKIPHKVHLAGCGSATTLAVRTTVTDGNQSKEVFKPFNEVYQMPSVDNFDVEKMLNAGVTLKEVNSLVLSPKEKDMVAFANKQEEKLNSNNEE